MDDIGMQGLNDEQIAIARKKFGYNRLSLKKKNRLLYLLKYLAGEPMIILLLTAAVIYFLTGNIADGTFMIFAIILVSGISFYQEARSGNALRKIKDLIQPDCKVLRNGMLTIIKAEELVVGDIFNIEEGELIPADGIIIRANDFSVNESILTGEALAVYKNENARDNMIYQGTLVSSGLATATVKAVGDGTRLGKIGTSVGLIKEEKTPLELQINNFVFKMAMTGTIVFLIVWALNYLRSENIADSLIKALTLAMSVLPEEIPVAFTTFMALGSWRLMKMGVVIKQIKTVETLGSATVICTDKTGTLTENRMDLVQLFVLPNQYYDPMGQLDVRAKELINFSMWASEPFPYDPMDISIHQLYGLVTKPDRRPEFNMVKEYPLNGTPPMMTHVFKNSLGDTVIAAKGALETLLNVSNLNTDERTLAEEAGLKLSSNGYRVLGVAEGIPGEDIYPESQLDMRFKFKGIIAFYDPPKKNISEVLRAFYIAGISVKMITGDNAATAIAIARQIGLRGYEHHISGSELIKMSEEDLQDRISVTNLFSRVFPEAKMRVINALKANHNIVAMTGDGVNDGPALKAAHIGIAMGKKGTQIAREAASLILLEDDLSKMIDAIAMGRRIYANLKKAIQYIISIHIPIILTVFLPLMLGWAYPNIFSPVHVIFLELIMGPTCSIIYENEPLEKNAMKLPPRALTDTFFNLKELATSIIQGLVITAGSLLVYHAVYQNSGEAATRTMVFIALITANIFLTLVNRSSYYSILDTLRYKNNLIGVIIAITLLFLGLVLYTPPLQILFRFKQPESSELIFSVLVGFTSVIWYEAVKWIKRLQ